MMNVGACLNRGAACLASAGIEDPWREARLLLAHATGKSVSEIIGYPERPVAAAAAFDDLIARRAAREPVSHLVGSREFWSLEFVVTADVLDPRPDSETLIQAAIDEIGDTTAPIDILDLGTGSGCLLGALLTEFRHANGVGVDRDPAAAKISRRNLDRLGLSGRSHIQVGDWASSLRGPFELIVSNPPYIPSEAIPALQPEVSRYEPGLALDGGPDGLAAYRLLFPGLAEKLTPSGIAILEFGDGQCEPVSAIATANGLEVREVRADLGGRPRCLVCARNT